MLQFRKSGGKQVLCDAVCPVWHSLYVYQAVLSLLTSESASLQEGSNNVVHAHICVLVCLHTQSIDLIHMELFSRFNSRSHVHFGYEECPKASQRELNRAGTIVCRYCTNDDRYDMIYLSFATTIFESFELYKFEETMTHTFNICVECMVGLFNFWKTVCLKELKWQCTQLYLSNSTRMVTLS